MDIDIIYNIKKNLELYSLKDIYIIANYLKIKDYKKYTKSILELKIAIIQKNTLKSSNISVKIGKLDVENNIETDLQDNCFENYKIKELLNYGTYGSIYNVESINGDQKYVIKFVNIYDNNAIKFKKEYNIANLFSNNNIGPKIYAAGLCTDKNENGYIGYIIMEKWDTDLNSIWSKNKKVTNFLIKDLTDCVCNFPKELIIKLKQLIEKIHKLGYIHYDINPKNILLKIKDNKIYDICIADFGFTNKIGKEKQNNLTDKQYYDYFKEIFPDYFKDKNLTLKDIKNNRKLLDYALLYYIESCNKN